MSKQNTPNNLVVSYLTMRKAVGWLGMSLPFILLVGNYFINKCNFLNNPWFITILDNYKYTPAGAWKSSISHYYYSTVGELFTGTLCAVALFMFSYNGHPIRKGDFGLADRTMTFLVGLFAIGVVIFPTSSDNAISDNIRIFLSSKNTQNIHFTFAALFFITLAFMCIINFRRAENVDDFGKGKDDNFFRLCGIVMLVCLILIFSYSFFLKGQEIKWLDSIKPTFVLESVALIFFGLSWLVKGQQMQTTYILKKIRLIKQ